MGKHIDKFIKLNYVLRYLKGNEEVVDLAKELVQLGLTKAKGSANGIYRNKPGTIIIYQWTYRYIKYGITGLSRMSKQEKKVKIDIDKYSKKDLASTIEILRELLNEEGIEITKEKIQKIQEKIKNSCANIKEYEPYFVSNNKFIKLINIQNSSFYYKSVKKPVDPTIVKRICDVFYSSNRTYGKRRIRDELKLTYKMNVGIKLVSKIMHEQKLTSICKRRRRHSDPKNTRYFCENLIGKDFRADEPQKKMYTDTTFIESPYAPQGFFYLSAFIDGYDYSTHAPVLSSRNDSDLVTQSFNDLKIKNAIIHSDHGSAYTSNKFREALLQNNCLQSMSSVGKSLENRPIEYFWGNLKEECINSIPLTKRTYEYLQNKIFEYFNRYNFCRRQSCLGKLAPGNVIGSCARYI